MGAEEITYGQTSRGFEVTFEGRTTIMGRPTTTSLREHIAFEAKRIEEAQRRQRQNVALLAAMESDELIAKINASEQRNAKAARTRAHNADPFGFNALARHEPFPADLWLGE